MLQVIFQVAVFQHTIFKHIFDSIGITTKGTLFNDPLYWNTLVNQPVDLSEFEDQNNNKSFRPPNTSGLGVVISTTSKTDINYYTNDQDPQWNGSVFTASSRINELRFTLGFMSRRSKNYTTSLYGQLQLNVEYTINGVAQPNIVRTLSIAQTLNLASNDFVKYR